MREEVGVGEAREKDELKRVRERKEKGKRKEGGKRKGENTI